MVTATRPDSGGGWQRVLMGTFAVLVWLPLLVQLTFPGRSEEIARLEKRRPATWPSFPHDGQELSRLPEKISAYLHDYYGLRSWLVRSNNWLYWRLGAVRSDKALLGRENWLFLKTENVIDEYRGLKNFDPSGLATWCENLARQRAWLATEGIPLLVMIPPNKHTIYPEYLPSWCTKIGATFLEQLTAALGPREEANFVDLFPILWAGKATGDLYFKTDSHWNHRGAFLAYGELMKKVKKYFPQAVILGENDFVIQTEKVGGMDTAALLGLSSRLTDTVYRFQKKEPSHRRAMRKIMANGEWEEIPLTTIMSNETTFLVRTDLAEQPRIMFVRDSYADQLMPFVEESFSEISYTYNWNGFPRSLIRELRPDIVVVEIVERAFSFNYANSKEY